MNSPEMRRAGPTAGSREGIDLDTKSIEPQSGAAQVRRVHHVGDLGGYGRRRATRELDGLLREMYPPEPPAPPSTFGLTDEELRRHGNDLVMVHGWNVAEVCQVLDVDPVTAS